MKFDNQDLKNALRSLTPETLAAHGFLQTAKKSGYVCPICGNGSGEDGTGLDFSQSGDTFLANCFRCGEGFDVIDVITNHYKGEKFNDALQLAAQEFGISTFNAENLNGGKKVENNETRDFQENNEVRDFTDLINSAVAKFDKFLEREGGSYRGLTAETLKKFRVGYLPYVGKARLPRVIVPTFSNKHYLARLPFGEDKLPENVRNSIRIKQHFGPKDIFNYEDLQKAADNDIVFMVEGEFDAMSICQVGFNAVAISACQLSKLHKKQLAEIEFCPRFVVLFDDDAAGSNNSANAVAALKRLGFTALSASLNFGMLADDNGEVVAIKDANDALRFSPEMLKNRLQEIFDDADKKFEEIDQIRRRNFEIKNSFRTSRKIFPDCPVDVAIPEGFYVRENGVFKIFKTPQLDEENQEPKIRYETVSFAPVFVSKVFTSSDFEQKKVEVVIFDVRRNMWLKKILRVEEIADYRSLAKKMCNWGAACDSKGAQRLGKYLFQMIYLEENRGKIEDISFFQKTGWLQEDFAEFAFPTGIEGKYPVFRGNFDYDAAFKERGDYEKSLALMRTLLTASATSRLALGAAYGAPLVRPLGVRNGQLHLCPRSGIGKSALVKAVMSGYGDPELLRHTFSCSSKFFEELPAKFNDLPLWVDEAESMDKFEKFDIGTQIYDYGEGLTRGRLNKDAEEKPRTAFAGVRITTGEKPLTDFTSKQGAKNRVIEIDFNDVLPSKVAFKIHRMFANRRTASYGHFGRKYVEWISKPANMRTLENYYDETYYKIRSLAALANGYIGKLSKDEVAGLSDEVVGLIPSHVQMLSLYYTGTYAFAKMAFAREEKFIKSIERKIDEDIDFVVHNFSQSKLTTTAERALPAILEARMTHSDRFQHITADGNLIGSLRNPTLGIDFGDGRIGFYPAQFHNFISELGFNAHEVIRGLSDIEVLDEGNSIKHLRQKSVQITLENGETQSRWLFVLNKDAEGTLERRRQEKIKYAAAG